jgi:hypothetical protein
MGRPLAYAKDLAAKRKAGERVGLVVLSLHDWDAGTWFAERSDVARLVLPADVPADEANFSICLACDVLLCGTAPDETFYAVCKALEDAGAASIWGDFGDGFWLLERAHRLWLAMEGPYGPAKLGAALRLHRNVMMMLRLGFYGSRVFDAARAALLHTMTAKAAA